MNSIKTKRTIVVLGALFCFSAMIPIGYAAGTASGTSISNKATISYSVNSVAQDDIESSPSGNTTAGAGNGTNTTIVVDNKIALTVASSDGAAVSVAPGSAAQVLTFTVTNNGNTVQDYSLSAAAESGTHLTVTDNFDATGVATYVESGATGGYQSGEDTAIYIDELAADGVATVYIVASIPLSQANGDGALYALLAQTAVGGTASSQGANITTDDVASADNIAVVQTVLTDDDGVATLDINKDGEDSAFGIYSVGAATLTITKTNAVLSDPINSTTNPKAIPGATVRYTITVANAAGAQAATGVTVVDTIPTNTTYVAASIVNDSVAQTDAADGDDSDYNITNTGAITASLDTVAAGTSQTVTFDVTID